MLLRSMVVSLPFGNGQPFVRLFLERSSLSIRNVELLEVFDL